MKKRALRYRVLVTCSVIVVTSCIRAGEYKTLMQDILTNPANRWKDLNQLPRQLISSMILHNHPIVPFMLNRGNRGIVVKTLSVSGRFSSAAFNSEGDMILTCSYDGPVKIWDTSSGKCLSTLLKETWEMIDGVTIRTTFRGHTCGDALSAVFTIAGDIVITWSHDKTPKVWETRSGTCLYDLRGHTDIVNTVAFNNAGDIILTSSSDGTVKLWDTHNGVRRHTIEQNTRNPNSAKFSGSGELVLTISGKDDTSTVKLWETNSGKCLHTLEGHTGSIWLAEFSNSGDLVVTISHKDYTSTVKLWDTESGKYLLALKGHIDRICSAKFSDSGDRVLTVSYDRTVKLWDTGSGECLHTLGRHSGWGYSPELNGSGDRCLTASSDGTAKLWDTKSGKCLKTLKGHTSAISSAVFNGSGDMILTCSLDGTAKLWDTKSGKCLKTLTGFIGGKSAVFNSSGDSVLLTGHLEKIVKLYDIGLLQKLHSFFSRDDGITLNQAVVLTGIYEIIICRKLLRKKLSSRKLYFRRLKDSLKSLSSSTEEQAISSDRVTFDFRICPHLQADYEMLPLEIRRILDKYVRKTASKNDCSTASTTDISDFESASTSEES